jgi:hypothetical protein
MQQGIGSSNKNDYLGASELNQVITYTNNKSNVTSELKSQIFHISKSRSIIQSEYK